MKITLTDDRGETFEITNADDPCMIVAMRDYFSPCGVCGQVAFDKDYNEELGCCKYCAV